MVKGRKLGYPETSDTALKIASEEYGIVLVCVRERKGHGPRAELSRESMKVRC